MRRIIIVLLALLAFKLPAQFSVISQTNPSCSGVCDGAVTFSATGGTPPYTLVTTGSSCPSLTVPPFTNTVTISGICPCTSAYYFLLYDNTATFLGAQSVMMFGQPPVNIVVSKTNQSCFGLCNGSATVTAFGGAGPYSYTWNPAVSTGSIATNLCAGQYTVLVKGTSGCPPTSNTFVISSPPPMAVSVSTSSVTCNGLCNGSVTVNASGGTPVYTYSFAPGGPTGMCAGNYTVTAVDSKSCSTATVFTIAQPPFLTAAISSTNAVCSGSNNGAACINPSGGTPPYTYSWNTAANTSCIGPVSAGSYTATAIDANSCTVSAIASINQISSASVSYSVQNDYCGLCIGGATVNATGGGGVYTFYWTPPVSTTNVATGLCSGIYSVSVTDMNNCVQNATVVLSNVAGPVASGSYTSESCSGCCDGIASFVVTGGSAPYTYTLDGTPVGGPTTYSALCGGAHTYCITDNLGCVTCFTFTIGTTTGISSFISDDFKMYPNPASENLRIEIRDKEFQILITDYRGMIVMTQDHVKDEINVSEFPEGIYLLTINAAERSYRTKIVIQR